MTQLNSFSTKLPIAALLCLAAACSDSVHGADPAIDLQQAFALSDTDASKLVEKVWMEEGSTRYTTFLTISADRSSGFLCNNDGKSVSGDVAFVEIDGRKAMVGKAGHGEGAMFIEQVTFKDDKLVIVGKEKGESYVETFRPIAVLPEICQRIRRGEEPTFEEYQASWGGDI